MRYAVAQIIERFVRRRMCVWVLIAVLCVGIGTLASLTHNP